MRIGSYNLFEGAPDTYLLLQQFVDEQALDVLCIQEANNWQSGSPSRLEDFALSTGLNNYVFGDSNTRFNLATFSRLPILSSEVLTEGFWHSAIQTLINTGDERLDIWNVHLNPKGEDERLDEVQRIIDADLAVGDFNSLSEADEYSEDDLLEQLVTQNIKKFGTTALRYGVTNYLARTGLGDLAVELGSNENTVPTPANKDMFHAAPMRLDYMFATPRVAALARSIEVVKNRLTDRISDHYPIVLTLN